MVGSSLVIMRLFGGGSTFKCFWLFLFFFYIFKLYRAVVIYKISKSVNKRLNYDIKVALKHLLFIISYIFILISSFDISFT